MRRYVPIAPDLFDLDGIETAGLTGSRCRDCGEHFFPSAAACAHCSSQVVDRVNLGTEGRVWTWTVQHFMPKPPYRPATPDGQFEPFMIGYIELAWGLKVEAKLVYAHNVEPAIGDAVSLVAMPIHDVADHTVVTYAFRHVSEGHAHG